MKIQATPQKTVFFVSFFLFGQQLYFLTFINKEHKQQSAERPFIQRENETKKRILNWTIFYF